MIDNHDRGLSIFDKLSDFFNFTSSDEGRGIVRGHDLSEAADNFAADGEGEFFKFCERFFELYVGITFESNTNNNDTFL